MPVIEPGAIKVFGVIHLVFGGLGVLWTLFSIASLALQKFFAQLMNMGNPGGDDETVKQLEELMASLNKELLLPSVLAIVFMAVLTVLLLVAGIALVKKRKNAVAASNRYAIASIVFKIVSLVLFFAVAKAAHERFYEKYAAFLESTGTPGAGDMTTMMNITGAISGVLGPILMMIYPILALAMLNRPAVKEFLANHGS